MSGTVDVVAGADHRPAPRYVLASNSPRRSDLLRRAGFDFVVRPPGIEEWAYPGGDPGLYAESLARAKAESVDGEVVIGADTIVVVDGQVLGKPAGSSSAEAMLRVLSGRTHQVITAVAVKDVLGIRSALDSALVRFRDLGTPEIQEYVAGGEPLDKAGAYGLQGRGREFVERLEGDPETVVGLPVRLLRCLLKEPPSRSPREE